MFEKLCGVVIGVRELFGSESKSQVYGHLHSLSVHLVTTVYTRILKYISAGFFARSSIIFRILRLAVNV